MTTKERWCHIALLERFDDKGGLISVGPLRLFYGRTSMHWTLQLHTKRWGYISKRFKTKRVKSCFYVSPDGFISTSTYYRGPNIDERVRAKIRKELFGHNYSLGAESTDTVRYALPIIQNTYYVSELKVAKK